MSSSIPRTQAVIFDLDGTLIDSEPLYREVDEKWLASRGVEVPKSAWDDFVGLGGPLVMDRLREDHGLEGETETLVAEKDQAYLHHARGRTIVFPEIRELLLKLLLAQVPLAVATSSRRRVLDAMLDETGLSAVFAVTVSSDDVEKTKPDPAPFLLAAKRLRVAPERCWVVEDSQYGVLAARTAGMRVIALPAPGHESIPAFGDAQLVVEGGAAKLDAGRALDTIGVSARGVASGSHDRAETQREPSVSAFRELIWGHFRKYGRQMPWRETTSAYEILVSEVMLQQTQVERVGPKYHAFLDRFPSVSSLADASLQSVLEVWQGLGYNRRARNLRDAARGIVERFGGSVPDEPALLETLPGIGPYTAGAIAAFAFNRPAVFLETNIRRVFLQVFFPGQESVRDRMILPLVGATLDHNDVRTWYQALMDYGAHLKTVMGNANRRSAHYFRQSPLVGSVREVRGRIVRLLTADGPVPMADLERRTAPDDERFVPAIEGLRKDGMIEIDNGTVSLS